MLGIELDKVKKDPARVGASYRVAGSEVGLLVSNGLYDRRVNPLELRLQLMSFSCYPLSKQR